MTARRATQMQGQRGAAAVELALLLSALLGVMLLLAPVPYAMLAKIQLERAAGKAARFATQTPDRGRPGLPAGQRRPTLAEVRSEATAAYSGSGVLATPVVTTATGVANCPRALSTTVNMQTAVDLGPFAA
ncbi:MAG: hypothetical protein ACRDZW_06910, partial [Acidimicrobiales bacterium]